MFKEQKTFKDPVGLDKRFWRNETEERRKALMPFLWGTLAAKGQLYGNRQYSNFVNVRNPYKFSYPGYNEILTGIPDERVNSNDKNYNANTTVLEFIQQQPGSQGKVAAYASWDVFPYIINDQRSKIPVSAGLEAAKGKTTTARELVLNELMPHVPNPLGDVRLDAFTFGYALEYLKKNHPKVLYIAFDETDDFAHSGEYGAYLHSAHSADTFVRTLWEYLQSDPQYKDKTTLLITTDHGRGEAATGEWKSHGEKVAISDQIWLAVMGPDTPATGEQKTAGQLYQNQIAKTLAAFLGLNYTNDRPVGEVIPTVLATGQKPK